MGYERGYRERDYITERIRENYPILRKGEIDLGPTFNVMRQRQRERNALLETMNRALMNAAGQGCWGINQQKDMPSQSANCAGSSGMGFWP